MTAITLSGINALPIEEVGRGQETPLVKTFTKLRISGQSFKYLVSPSSKV
jgi:hypothetical protein